MPLPYFSKNFHEKSKDHNLGHDPIPSDPSAWPDQWKKAHYKVYARLPKLLLPADQEELKKKNLFNVLGSRRSRRDFNRNSFVTKDEFSLLMKYFEQIFIGD